MKNTSTRIFICALIFAAGIVPCLEPGGSFAKSSKQADVWRVRENLVNRFGAEWFKIGMLHNELNSLSDVLADLRDFELFPADLTGLDKNNLIRYDRKIESLEKRHALLSKKAEGFKQPLFDAMTILREMVVRQPVESMFELLEQGDMERIAEMLAIKHQIDTLWRSTDTLLTSVMVGIGITADAEPAASDAAEFFSILKANLGKQSEHYYKKLAMIKDTLAGRASDRHMREMFSVESHRIKRYVKESKLTLSERKIAEAEARYRGKINLGELTVLAARIALLSGRYQQVLLATDHLPASGTYSSIRTLYRLQSLYALHQYDSLLNEARNIDVTQWKGARRNLIIWIIMESALALQEKEVYVKIASLVDRSSSYALHVMHALGRSYLASNDPGTALSIFEGAMKFSTRSDMDKLAAREIRLAIAQTNYELGRYEKSLSLFFDLLSENAEFERALQGILWCYLSIGMNDKAETTLRKLINQSPESRYAAEAFLVLAKRYQYKAQYEWKKVLYLTKEEQRLKELIERIERKQAFDSALVRDKKIIGAKKELSQLLGKLRAEPRDDRAAILSYYDNSKRITDLINSYYATGSFQRVAFTEKREQLLHFLDSVMLAATKQQTATTTGQTVSNRGDDIGAIKSIVAKSSSFSVETDIERFRFEQDYLNWQKSQLNLYAQEAMRPLHAKTDSASRAKAAWQKKHFTKILDSLLVVEDTLKRHTQTRLIRLLQAQLAGSPDSADAAYFHYHLGERYYAEENSRYTGDFEKFEKEKTAYERKMASFREGKLLEMPKEPPPPRIDHSASMLEFRSVLRLSPESKTAAGAHYSMAWCFNDLGRFDSALAHMEMVATNHPESPYAPQAWMYVGEYLFDKGDLSRAIQSYQAVMKYPESEWFDKALYKLAWSQYRLSNPEKAISSFLALAELGSGHGGKNLLEKESMDYVAISFSEADMTGEKGLERATAFAKKLGDPDRGSQILHRLAQVYRDQGRYDMSKKTYRTLMKMNPAFRNMPGVENEFLLTLERDATPEEANILKIEFWKKFHKGSVWSKAQSDAEAIATADSLAEKQLYEATLGFHQLALQDNDTSAYTKALDVYTSFIRAYPKSPRASECHYNLAEIEFSLGNYLKAAEEYIAVSKRYPDSKLRETAAWNAIVASQNNLKKEGTPR